MAKSTKDKCALLAMIALSILVAEMWANFAVVAAIYPFAPTTDLHICTITDFAIEDCDYWNGKWYQLGSRSTYTLSASSSLANVTCAKNTGCKPYRVRKPSDTTCYSINDGTCWELVALHDDIARAQREDAYILWSLLLAPIAGFLQFAIIILILTGIIELAAFLSRKYEERHQKEAEPQQGDKVDAIAIEVTSIV